MGFFSKLFKEPEIDMEKSDANAKKMRALFHQAVGGGEDYRLIFGYTEDVSRFNYGFVHGSKTKIGNLLVGWNEDSQTIVVVPTVPDLSGCGKTSTATTQDYMNIPLTHSLSILIRKAILASTPMTGWRTKHCMSMCLRRKNWRHLQNFL